MARERKNARMLNGCKGNYIYRFVNHYSLSKIIPDQEDNGLYTCVDGTKKKKRMTSILLGSGYTYLTLQLTMLLFRCLLL